MSEVGRLPRPPRRRFLEDEERRHWLATTAVVALALLLAAAMVLGVGLRVANRNAEKNERQSVACIEQGGAWIDYDGTCVYSRRAP